ncbi:MAG: Ig-like domain-containing protein [Spirochaetia bacterium]|nr:Ig-like domain-containing protein [Spirochaetia bacterium]
MKRLFLFVLIFSSCTLAEEYSHMKTPKVSDCSYGEGCIEITFSSEMEKGITEQAFSCLCNNEAISGTFVWIERTLYFYPDSGIKGKSRYEVEVGTRAEDKYGNSLKEVFSYTFSTFEKENRFSVQKMNISDGDTVADLLQPIEIRFSSPVDQAAFYQGFGVSPGVRGAISLADNGHVVVFSPLEKLDWNSVYTVTLKKSISDQYGNTLPSDYSVTFTTVSEPENELEKVGIKNGVELVLGNIVNRGIPKDAELVLTYSGTPDSKTLRSPISISPAQDYTTVWNSSHTQCTVTFKKRLPYKTLMELVAGKDRRYLLYVDEESSKPLEVQEIKFYQDYTTGVGETLQYGSGILFETGSQACFEFVFSSGIDAEILSADAYGAVDIAVSRGNLTIDLERLETERKGPGVLCVRVFCSITAGTIQTPVVISVNGTLKDSYGNTLENDYVLRVNSL